MISNVEVYGLEESIIASGYPQRTELYEMKYQILFYEGYEYGYNIVDNDYTRANKLGKTPIGSGHDNFLNGVIVQFDLTLTVKAWTEAERYHFFDFVSSQSTMHCISKFELSNQYIKYVDSRMIDIMEELKEKYNQTQDKEDYLKLLYSNPCGFKLTARMTTNYRQLKIIYGQRKNHPLPEWKEFCKWVLTLPRFTELTDIC